MVYLNVSIPASVWHSYEQLVVAVCGVLPVAGIVPVFSAGTYRHYTGATTTVLLCVLVSYQPV